MMDELWQVWECLVSLELTGFAQIGFFGLVRGRVEARLGLGRTQD